jgi:hypothetical protein
MDGGTAGEGIEKREETDARVVEGRVRVGHG